jgi:hypothetical protein
VAGLGGRVWCTGERAWAGGWICERKMWTEQDRPAGKVPPVAQASRNGALHGLASRHAPARTRRIGSRGHALLS